MKKSDTLLTKIQEWVWEYSDQLNLCKIPDIVYTRKEVLDLPRHQTAGKRTSASKYYGISYCKANIIFINVKLAPNTKHLRDTVIHELCHLRFPYMAHTKEFYEKIRQVKKGKRFAPYQKKERRT